MNPQLWTYRESVSPRVLEGYRVESTDGELGTVDDATYAVGGSWLVVDARARSRGAKVMLPARVVWRIDPAQTTVFVDRSTEEIHGAPAYDDRTWDAARRDALDRYYAPYYTTLR